MRFKPLLLFGSVLALPLWAQFPDAETLLLESLRSPSISYEGEVKVTRVFGGKTRVETAHVLFRSPQWSRWEFRSPEGRASRIVVSDGNEQKVLLVRRGVLIKGGAVKSVFKEINEEQEFALLRKNYSFKVAGQETVAERPVWVLEVTPRASGKLSQRLWIDQETRAVLGNQRFGRQDPFRVESRFVRFQPRASVDPGRFRLEISPEMRVMEPPVDPDFLPLDQLNRRGEKMAQFPSELPGGYVFESGNIFKLRGQGVRHLRYTDGLSVVSLFETDRPVRLPKGHSMRRFFESAMRRQPLFSSSAGPVLQWKMGGHHYTLMGDCSKELLQEMSEKIR